MIFNLYLIYFIHQIVVRWYFSIVDKIMVSMNKDVIKYMAWLVPLGCLFGTITIMKIVELLGLLQVSFDISVKTLQKFMMLGIIYLILVLLVIKNNSEIIKNRLSSISKSGKISLMEYDNHVKKTTKIQLQKLKKSKQFQKWKDKFENVNVVYELLSDSSEEPEQINCHRIAVAKKLF